LKNIEFLEFQEMSEIESIHIRWWGQSRASKIIAKFDDVKFIEYKG